jgi:hypothetical protein
MLRLLHGAFFGLVRPPLSPEQNVQWMDAATKAEALLKINRLLPQVGHQDPAFDDK